MPNGVLWRNRGTVFFPKENSALGSDGTVALPGASIGASEEMHWAISDLVSKKLWEVKSLPLIPEGEELQLALSICSKKAGDKFEKWLRRRLTQ